MIDRKGVIKWLEILYVHYKCLAVLHPKDFVSEYDVQMAANAIALLKEQEPRVVELSEIEPDVVYWMEEYEGAAPYPWAMREHMCNNIGNCYVDWYGYYVAYENEYNRRWRCWTSKPTPEQMAGVEWDG